MDFGLSNKEIAARLEEAAELLEAQGAGLGRVADYRAAAAFVRDAEPLARMSAERRVRLMKPSATPLACAVDELAEIGRWAELDRLRGRIGPEATFATLPGVGPSLAAALTDKLRLQSLEDLEAAVARGGLSGLRGVGPRRAAAIRSGLQAAKIRRRRFLSRSEPPARRLLALDRLYWRKAARGELPRVAPDRFNPLAEAWLPLMHIESRGWWFSVMNANAGRADGLATAGSDVRIYFAGQGACERVRLIESVRSGSSIRRRVRGREAEASASPPRALLQILSGSA